MWFVYPPQNQQHKVQANRLKGKHSNRTLKGHYIPRQLASLCSNPLYFISSNQDKLQWSRRVLWEWDVLGLKWNIKHCYAGYWPLGDKSVEVHFYLVFQKTLKIEGAPMMPMMGAMPVAAAPAQVTCQITYVIVILNYWVNISDWIGVLWPKKPYLRGFPQWKKPFLSTELLRIEIQYIVFCILSNVIPILISFIL